jgi:hypothetical protein
VDGFVEALLVEGLEEKDVLENGTGHNPGFLGGVGNGAPHYNLRVGEGLGSHLVEDGVEEAGFATADCTDDH